MHHYRLKAINSEKDIYRWYEIQTTPSLFGPWALLISSGRMGAKGRTRVHIFETEGEMNKTIQNLLKKRLTAERRIGCNYTLID